MSCAPRVVLDTKLGLAAWVCWITGDRDFLLPSGEISCPVVTADQFLSALAKS